MRVGNVFGVARLGDVVRHVGPLGRLGALGDDDEDVLVVGRELQIGCRLTLGQLELRQRARLVLLLGLLLLLGLDARVLDQLLLFGLDELLAVGVARIALARLRRRSAARCRTRCRRAARGTDCSRATKVTADSPRAQRGIDFAAGRAGDLASRAGDRVDQHDVALIDEQRRGDAPCPTCRRTAARCGAPRPSACASSPPSRADDPGGGLVLAGAAPFEVQPRGIAGPPQAGRRIPDQLGSAHDAVDGQDERRAGLAFWARTPGAVARRAAAPSSARREARGDWHGILKERGMDSIQLLNRNIPAERLHTVRLSDQLVGSRVSSMEPSECVCTTDSPRPNCRNRGRSSCTVGVRLRSDRTVRVAPARRPSAARRPAQPAGRIGPPAVDRRGRQAGARAEPRHPDPADRPADSGHRRSRRRGRSGRRTSARPSRRTRRRSSRRSSLVGRRDEHHERQLRHRRRRQPDAAVGRATTPPTGTARGSRPTNLFNSFNPQIRSNLNAAVHAAAAAQLRDRSDPAAGRRQQEDRASCRTSSSQASSSQTTAQREERVLGSVVRDQQPRRRSSSRWSWRSSRCKDNQKRVEIGTMAPIDIVAGAGGSREQRGARDRRRGGDQERRRTTCAR